MTSTAEICRWLEGRGLPADSLIPLTGDVSARRYFRLASGPSQAIVAVYPRNMLATCQRFAVTTDLLSSVGLRVPEILDCDCDLGFMLLEDVGPWTLYDLPYLDEASLESFFWQAVANLPRIQSLPRSRVATLNPALDAELLRRELQQTWDCFLVTRGIVAADDFTDALDESFTKLCRGLAQDELIPCHRDYMVRNLVPVDPSPELAVLDHQDLRLGPRYYDLASLLNDSLFPSPDLEERILDHCLSPGPEERIRYHRAAAQRTLKAIGTYEAFSLRGFDRHRRLIPATLDRALHHLCQLPEAVPLADDLALRLRPPRIC